MDLFDLVAKISLDSSGYEKGLSDSESKAQSFGGKLKTTLGGAVKTGGKVLGAITGATIAFGTAVVKQTNDLAAYGDHIDKASQKMGISAQAYQEWDAVLQHSGTSIDAMSRGMITLQKQAESGSDAFEKLGISQEQLASMSPEQLFESTIAGLQGMENGAERTALASQLLGGSAKELGALLNTSAEDVAEMRQRVRDLGGVMSDDAVKASAKYMDSMQDMKTAISGLSRGIFTQFMPSVTTIMDGLTAVFSGDTDSGLALINEGINDFLENITNSLPHILEVGKSIVFGLLSAITQNLPAIIQAGVELIIQLITGLISAIPQLVEMIPEIVVAIYNGIVEAGPELLAAGAELLQWLGQGIMTLLGLAAEWGKGIAQKLKAGLVSAWNAIVAWVSTGMSNIGAAIQSAWNTVTAPFISMWNTMVSFVTTAWNNIKTAISTALQNISSKISSVWNTIKSTVTSVLNAISSTVSGIWDGIVSFISNAVENISSGISSGFETAKSAVTSIVDGIKSTVESVFNGIKSFLEPIINWLKNIFNFNWSLPHIALPHFKLVGRFSFAPPQVPKLSVDWYKKAYDDPFMFTQPTVIGNKGFGDGLGGEMVYGHENLMKDIREAVASEIGGISIYLDGKLLVGGTADVIDTSLGDIQKFKLRWEGA